MWHRDAVGGMWEEIGKLQFDFLVGQGLRPEHYLLDVGCGSLRGGVHFIGYLQPSHYFGIDISKELLDAGREELNGYKLAHKRPILVQMDNFDFTKLNQKFDYALAQSIFTHLPLNSIIRCIIKMGKVLIEEGGFYATFLRTLKVNLIWSLLFILVLMVRTFRRTSTKILIIMTLRPLNPFASGQT